MSAPRRNSIASLCTACLPMLAACAIVASCLVLHTAPARAQATPPAGLQLPSEPAQWINSSPLDMESLKGKAILFYFFEEGCPTCRGKWPAILETAKKHRQDPILFVGVNSGNDRGTVEEYARSVHCDWPVIVDTDRSLEKAADVGELSLKNIMQFKYINGKGEAKRGSWNDMEGTVTSALQGAAWRIDPASMPEELIPAWRNIELLNYPPAAKSLKKASTSGDAKIKAGAQKLLDYIGEESKPIIEAAKANMDKDKWEAYKQYDTLSRKFAGYPVATEALAARKTLVKEPEVKTQLAALKSFEQSRAQLNSPKPAVRKRAQTNIEKLIADQPDTEAAKLAKAMGAGQQQ